MISFFFFPLLGLHAILNNKGKTRKYEPVAFMSSLVKAHKQKDGEYKSTGCYLSLVVDL